MVARLAETTHEMREGRKSGKLGTADAAVAAAMNTEVAPKL